MESAQVVALAILGSYFGVIIGLFKIILRSIPATKERQQQRNAFKLLTVLSFAHTWYYMFSFMRWSYVDWLTSAGAPASSTLTRISDWLVDTPLFEQAWAAVCAGPNNWFWSEQLCLYTALVWTVFLFVESQHRQVPNAWAYMLLGQLVAISVASSLFFLALISSPPVARPSKSRYVPLALWMPVVLSLLTIFAVPYTTPSTFLPNLLVMHGLLVIPLMPFPSRLLSSQSYSLPLRRLYDAFSASSLALRLLALYRILSPFSLATMVDRLIGIITTLHSHPAQSSIGYDVLWACASFNVWALYEGSQSVEDTVFGTVGGPLGGLFVVNALVVHTRRERALDQAKKTS